MITVRPAVAADVPAMSRVMTASIKELCAKDHGGSEEVISRWTANKSEAGVRAMLANPATRMFVAELDNAVAAVGSVTTTGEVALNYVDPSNRFAGVSRALLAAMEDALRGMGIVEARLDSTATAYRFYLGAGWSDAGPEANHGGLACRPMKKRL